MFREKGVLHPLLWESWNAFERWLGFEHEMVKEKKKTTQNPGVMESGNKEQIDMHAECL